MRIAAFDIETTGLDASYGRFLCACFKFLDDPKVKTVRARRYKDEPRALAQLVKIYNKADIIVTWNGKLFDIPFVNARLMVRRKEHDVAPAVLDPGKKHVDLRWMSAKLRTRGNRLDGASRDLGAKFAKYTVGAEGWIKAADGHVESFDKIVHHCELDVMLTEEMFEILKPYVVRITR
jgi:uncharacterized protein YprB with RNaseH-like and TPR domain